MTPSQQKYLEEYEKYKNVPIDVGCRYVVTSRPTTIYEVVSIDQTDERVSLENKTGLIISKTLHWCRKNLTLLVTQENV